MSYYNLHTHTEYSNLRLLDSTNKLQKVINNAIELGLNGIAITDHETVSGHVKAIQRQKELINMSSDFKIILGNEIYLVDSLEEVKDNYQSGITKFYHFILLAKDSIGAEQIRRISSSAWEHSFFTGKMERVPTIKQELVDIIGEDKGHIIASSACAGGEIAHWIMQNRPDKCLEFIDWCQEVFLPENFYLEMQPNDCEEQTKINQTIIKISNQLDVPYIISTDVHYLSEDQSLVHEAYLNSREDSSRETAEFYRTCYLMTEKEIHQWMDKQIGKEQVNIALENTNKIGKSIEFFDLEHSQVVPKVPIPEFVMEHSFKDVYEKCEYIKKFAYSEDIHDQYFLYLIENGWWEKEYKDTLSKEEIFEMMERINVELQAIWESSIKIKDNIASYYITAVDIVKMMWDDANSLVGCSRGSIAAFYTAYLIGLQQINPMRYDIPYWRHLHESRPEMPDVDIDSEKSRREAIIEATRKKFGYDKVLNICAFRTEGSKSALLTTCRGLGISSDIAQYLASLIPVVRGNTTSLGVMVNGDLENDIKPNVEFINECSKYEGLLETAMTIEGLICGRTVHASGVIIFESPYTELNCMMRSPNGQPTTQWDMDDSTYAGGLKYDYLTITNLDSMHKCLDFLVEYGYIEWQGSLRETYNKYFHPDVLDYTSEDMWKMAENLEIVNLFQFMTSVGQQAIQKIKPRSLIELGVANAVMRLMAQDKGAEQPLDKYVRYKNNIIEWYNTMKEYGLTDEEVSTMEKHLSHVSGMATMQEEVMRLVMDEHISNFDMVGANKLRKSIAKKKKKLQQEAKDNFYKVGKSVGASQNLLDYVWKECIVPQLGYSFSQPHVLGYSTIGVQEMNMAYKYPIIYWNCANLIVDSASDEETEGATDYGKVGVSISNMQEAGIDITLPLINEANFGFSPDEKHNRIIFGFKAMNGIGDDVARIIVENRPYTSIEDFCTRLIDTKLVKNSQMVKLIKGGCFTELHNPDRRTTMDWYLRNYVFKTCDNLTMQQFNKMKELEFIPKSMDLPLRMINFKNYVLDDEGLYKKHIIEGKKIPKRGYHDGYYILDNNSQPFFKQHFTEDSVVDIKGEYYIVSEKKFTKEADSYIQPLKDWMALPETLDAYNERLFQELWNKHAEGSVPHWNMEALCYYDGEHELEHVNERMYGIVNFFDLPEEPEPYEWYTRYINGEPKSIPKYKISRIAGTVLNADNNHHLVTILTKYGAVNVKMNKGHYAFYNKTISEMGEDGKKKRIEESWLKRGNLIIVSGYRRDDQFRPLVYNDTIYKHTVNLIQEVREDGTLLIQSERTRIETE